MVYQPRNQLTHLAYTPEARDEAFVAYDPWTIDFAWPSGDQDGFGGPRPSDPATLYVVAHNLEPWNHDDITSPVFSVSLMGVVEEEIASTLAPGASDEDCAHFTRLAARLREIAAEIDLAVSEVKA